MTTFAEKITGGKTLANIYEILAKGTPQKSTITFKSDAEMKAVLGDPEQNAFLLQQQKETVQLKKTIQQIRKQFVLQPPKK
jgi:hypothetical protein